MVPRPLPPVSFSSPASSFSTASSSPRTVVSTEEFSSSFLPSLEPGDSILESSSSNHHQRRTVPEPVSGHSSTIAPPPAPSSTIAVTDPSLTPTQIVDRLPVIASVGVPTTARSAMLHDRQSPMLGGGDSSGNGASPGPRLAGEGSGPRPAISSSPRLYRRQSIDQSPTRLADTPPSRTLADISGGSSRSPGRSPVPVAGASSPAAISNVPQSVIERYASVQQQQNDVSSGISAASRYNSTSTASLRSDVLYTSAGHGDGQRRPSPVPPSYDHHRSLSRSPSRGGGGWDPELAVLRSRIAAGVRVGRRATADAPSTGGMADRIGLFSQQHSGGDSPQPFADNPFTSRPPSSASEIEIELPSSQNSTVSSPIPRPVTARGRYSVEGGRSSVDGHHGRTSADSFRRSSSSDPAGQHGHQGEPQPHPPTPADVTAVVEEGFASDSSSSRPGSRLERPDSRLGDSRSAAISNLNRRSVVRLGGAVERSAAASTRRNTLSRLMEEDIDSLRASSASSPNVSAAAYPRLSSPMSLPGRSPRADSDLNDARESDLQDPRDLEEEEVSLSQDSSVTEDHTYSRRSFNRSLSEGSDGIQAEIHAEENNPPQELVALASVEDEIEISDNQIQIHNTDNNSGSGSGVGLVSASAARRQEQPAAAGDSEGVAGIRAPNEAPAVNPQLSMYPSGASLSILDSDDDADMERSIRQEEQQHRSTATSQHQHNTPQHQHITQHLTSMMGGEGQRNLRSDSGGVEQPPPANGGLVGTTIVEVPRSAIEPVVREEDEIMVNSVDSEEVAADDVAQQDAGGPTDDGIMEEDRDDVLSDDPMTAAAVSREEDSGHRSQDSSQVGSETDSRDVQEPGSTSSSSSIAGASSSATSGAGSLPEAVQGTSTSNSTSSGGENYVPSRRQQSLDISRLARHIQHMQSICLESLEHLPQSRKRRQVIRLQGIRRQLEDLHRQIRNLQSTVQGAVASTSAAADLMSRESGSSSMTTDSAAERGSSSMSTDPSAADRGSSSMSTNSAAADRGSSMSTDPSAADRGSSLMSTDSAADSQADTLHQPPHHIPSPSSSTSLRHASYSRTIRTRRRSGSTRTGGVGGVLAARNRLTRAQSELVSRLHATVRAMEMSPDLTRRASNSVGERLTEASQSVLERHETEQRAIRSRLVLATRRMEDLQHRREDLRHRQDQQEHLQDRIHKLRLRRQQEKLERRQQHRLQEQQHLLQDNLSYRNSLNGRCAPDGLSLGVPGPSNSRRNNNTDTATAPQPSSSSSSSVRIIDRSNVDTEITLTARNGLRSLSQRLERVLRQRREALEAAEASADELAAVDRSGLLAADTADSLLTPGSRSAAGSSASASASRSAADRVATIRETLLSLDAAAAAGGGGVVGAGAHMTPSQRMLLGSSSPSTSATPPSSATLPPPPALVDHHDSSTPSDSEEESYQSLIDSAVVAPPRGGSPFSRHSPFRTSFSGSSGVRRGLTESGRSAVGIGGGLDPLSGQSSSSGSVDRNTDDPLLSSARESYYSRLNRRRMGYVRAFERRLENRLNRSQLPPLSNLILRRLHHRINTNMTPGMDDNVGEADGEEARVRTISNRTYREAIREMVDQLSIDQQEAESNLGLDAGLGSGGGAAGGSGGGPPFDPHGFRRVGGGVGFSTYMPVGSAGGGSGRHVNLDLITPSSSRILNRMSFMARQRLDERQRITTNSNMTYRIQTWDFWGEGIPDIRQANKNIVVQDAKIHNDACVDISQDGCLLVTLAPSNLPMTTVVGLYSLEKRNLGQVLATYSLESCAVSVSLSPTSRHLLVGLTSKIRPSSLNGQLPLMAQVFRMKLPGGGRGQAERGRLIHRKDIHQVGQGHMSLNCIRWIPIPGQGFVFATNTGLLKILR